MNIGWEVSCSWGGPVTCKDGKTPPNEESAQIMTKWFRFLINRYYSVLFSYQVLRFLGCNILQAHCWLFLSCRWVLGIKTQLVFVVFVIKHMARSKISRQVMSNNFSFNHIVLIYCNVSILVPSQKTDLLTHSISNIGTREKQTLLAWATLSLCCSENFWESLNLEWTVFEGRGKSCCIDWQGWPCLNRT